MKRLLSVLQLLAIGAESLVAQSPQATRAAFRGAALSGNRVSCVIDNTGQLCSDQSPVQGGGFWPAHTPDQYIFTSGLQLAGLIPPAAGGGKPTFAWAGDTTGAYFEDFRGTQLHGDGLTYVFNSRDTGDVRLWPNGAVARDTGVFDARLLGRNAISQQDLWVRYWDGNPNFLGGRTHPMGIVVDQRAMVFTGPQGNDDIVYFVFTLYNVSARDATVYANPTIDPALRAEIATLGAQFQDSAEQRLGVAIPDAGYRIDSVYAGLAMDADVGDASQNYSNLILPFDLGLAYKSDFRELNWDFPLELFGAPLTKAPGLVGVRFLRSPAAFAMFSNLTGSATGHPAPVGVPQLWRYLSGHESIAAGDAACTSPDPQARHFCFLLQNYGDTRFYQSTGPFSLDPGEAKTLVLAYVFAAPTPAVEPYIGGELKPGIPAPGDSIAADTTRVRDLERAAGWSTQSDANGDGIIEENEVTAVPRSLLDKARIARAVADHKFLLPQAPDAPAFFLIPGDNQVTVVWQKSATETGGDPYFAIASDSTSPLYDRNFRQNDVEGYRIYRGRDPRSLQLVAQLNYGNIMLDFTGSFYYPGDCAPELGITTDCPDFTNGFWRGYGPLVQVPPGGRTLVNGHVFLIRSDTAITGGNSGFPSYGDAVNFVLVDRGVRNSFSYVYAVTAFDVNSITSGPSSLESPRVVKGVTPRAPSGQEILGTLGASQLIARGQVLDSSVPSPTLDPVTGIFSGPAPPTNGLSLLLTGFVPEVIGDSAVTLTIDSIAPGNPSARSPALYHVRVRGPGTVTALVVPLTVDFFSSPSTASVTFPAVTADPALATRFGGDSLFTLFGRASFDAPGTWRLASWGRASVNFDPGNSDQAGPRWWAGSPNENTNAPNELQCTPAFGFCIQPNLSRNAGRLPGVTTLFHLQSYSTVPNTPMRELEGIGATVARAADFRLYWGAAGHVDSVIDVTHGVPVSYAPGIAASWGILTDSSFLLAGTNAATTADSTSALLTWSDALCVAPAPTYLNQCGGAAQAPARLLDHARLSPVAAQSSTYGGTAALTATGNGFILYLNGHFFLMQLPSLPADGTVWNARFFAGSITGTALAGDYQFVPEYLRPPAVPGLEARISFTGSRLDPRFTTDSLLSLVHTVPDPYYVSDPLETGPLDKALRFVHLPAQSIVRIYSTSGILVRALIHNDPTGGGEETWDLRSRTGRFVASGVYFFHVETPDGHHRVGRFTIVTFRPPGAR
jgi:hypothetical protein